MFGLRARFSQLCVEKPDWDPDEIPCNHTCVSVLCETLFVDTFVSIISDRQIASCLVIVNSGSGFILCMCHQVCGGGSLVCLACRCDS